MNCDEAKPLLHALADGELDAIHARGVESHLATCSRCATELAGIRNLRAALSSTDLRFAAPAGLQHRIAGMMPAAGTRTDRRALLKGLAAGSALSALAASGIVAMVMRMGDEQRIFGEVVSAHLRSLQADHLTDVESSNQHTVKPWFNGRIDIAPPVVDLTGQGFTLVGGRLDYIDGKAVAAIVYRRRVHVINLFVAPGASADRRARIDQVQGFNIRRWSEQGFNLLAVSDLNADELQEFGEKFEAALRSVG